MQLWYGIDEHTNKGKLTNQFAAQHKYTPYLLYSLVSSFSHSVHLRWEAVLNSHEVFNYTNSSLQKFPLNLGSL